ncbi:MAG: hypothetical protein A2289_04645 [Deltaproteobacteria bacterium RIFOXYA12_FULL_58_15]|nr:MAG: hypothetical protein A2289_04645 [Deltaproteobacteria bacterium RIFOXYA12_FULL_58_15]OGR09903.1 MAG: hypothetical protein A2341_27315 [Deltaproteobacteria bacterium RIFOXYB12_FULL_58_9]
MNYRQFIGSISAIPRRSGRSFSNTAKAWRISFSRSQPSNGRQFFDGQVEGQRRERIELHESLPPLVIGAKGRLPLPILGELNQYTAKQWELTAARAGTGLTQERFARFLGVSKRTLQEWEQWGKQPSGAAGLMPAIPSPLIVTPQAPLLLSPTASPIGPFLAVMSRLAWINNSTLILKVDDCQSRHF